MVAKAPPNKVTKVIMNQAIVGSYSDTPVELGKGVDLTRQTTGC
jgi:hypothetical protein